jgi:hypothetical protein
MAWNAKNHWAVIEMKKLNERADLYATQSCSPYDYSGIEWAVTKGEALALFYFMVRNGAPWDFKDAIGNRLGPGITLCTSSGCNNNVEYSVPGNIFYGYIGLASGFSPLEIKWGAGWAEKHDPALNKHSREYTGAYGGVTDTSSPDQIEWNLGDDPQDNIAVTLGLHLWNDNKSELTLPQFTTSLTAVIPQLAQCRPNPASVDADVASQWPYSVGYFNNDGEVYVNPRGCP